MLAPAATPAAAAEPLSTDRLEIPVFLRSAMSLLLPVMTFVPHRSQCEGEEPTSMAPVGAARRVGAAPLHALWLTGKYAALRLAAQARPGAA